MPHGTPDWSDKRKTAYVSAVLDAGELAARLGSPYTFDRRGDVIFIEDFAEGIQGWSPVAAGAGASAEVTTAFFNRGGQCARLVGGSGVSDITLLYKRIGLPALGRVGIVCTFCVTPNLGAFAFYADYATAASRQRYGWRYDHENTRIQIYDQTGSWVNVKTSINLLDSSQLWVDTKLVVDLDKGKYAHLLLGRSQYDLSAYGPRADVPSAPDRLILNPWMYSRAGTNGTVYVDSIIATINEP